MNPNLPKIFFITLISIVMALVYNHFNHNGLKLIREERILTWESDSIASFNKTDSLFSAIDSAESKQSVNSLVTENRNQITESFKSPKAIKINFAYKLFKQRTQFIDARSPEEFSEGHILGAVNIPFYRSENYSDAISKLNKSAIIVVYCQSEECDESTLAGNELFEMGFKSVYVFIGGYDEWTKNNYPINTKIN